jgi:hypothetical protein
MFKSIAEIKAKCEHIRKGQIFPRRIMKANKRKYQHIIKAGCNIYALPTRAGYLAFSENQDGHYDCVVHVDTSKHKNIELTVTCSPYHENHETVYYGNHELSEPEFLALFNQKLAEMNWVSETDYLLASPANAERLMRSIKQVKE